MLLIKRYRGWLPLLLIFAVACGLRVYAVDRLPPGLFGDEAVEGLDALDVLAGNFNIWFHAHLGREPIFVYLDALSYALFGVTPLATRLPAILAGLLTIPAAYWLAREWSAQLFDDARARRLAFLTTALLAISFWHIQMTRNAHRDTLLPLVEAIGYALLWRAIRTRDWRFYAVSGAILGLAIYTYSPGRFVGVFVGLFMAVELAIQLANKFPSQAQSRPSSAESQSAKANLAQSLPRLESPHLNWRGIIVAGLLALIVMLPLGIYFAQNPVQFSRRFDSTSIFDAASPVQALASSIVGNVAQFFVPDLGYASKHYNLPGKPVFDLLLAPWFLAGIVIAFARIQRSEYRFLLLWFVVMMVPAFLTADMIPKGVRVLGVVPGVFVFPALAMDWLIERAMGGTLNEAISTTNRARLNRMELAMPNPFAVTITFGLIALSLVGSTVWTTYDYFVAWADLPELPIAFDSDYVQVSEFINQPSNYPTTAPPIYVSAQVYRHPTFMLLGKHVPTSQYYDPSTRVREFDARSTMPFRADESNAIYVFVRDQAPPDDWFGRIAPNAQRIGQGDYFTAYRLGSLAPSQQLLDVSFNPFLKLVGYTRYADFPTGLVLYWQVVSLPSDRADMQMTLTLHGALVTQGKQKFGVPPMEWAVGDTIAEWYSIGLPAATTQFSIEIKRGDATWLAPSISLE